MVGTWRENLVCITNGNNPRLHYALHVAFNRMTPATKGQPIGEGQFMYSFNSRCLATQTMFAYFSNFSKYSTD